MPSTPRKVFLFALPRSGSTLLCDLLTVPGRSVLLHEPMILRNFGDGRATRIKRTLEKVGITVSGEPGEFQRGQPAQSWFDQSVIPRFSELDFWGVKEVYLSDARRLVELYGPDTILLLWRDPRDVSISMLELMNRALMSHADRKTLKDEAWAFECLCESAEVLGQLVREQPHHLVRYEDLIRSADERQAVLDAVGLPEFGDAQWSLEDDASGVRTPESARHQDLWSNRSIDRWKSEAAGWRRVFADVCHAAMQPLSSQLGYDDARLDIHRVCAPPRGTRNERLHDPHYVPGKRFDFVYARRRARKRVARLLEREGESQPVRLLDVGAGTAALAFMLPQHRVTVVDDAAPGAKLISKKWRSGVFPALDSFDLVSFLFSLEYVIRPFSLLEGLLERGKRVLISYHCSDDIAEPLRTTLEFKSHLSRADWVRFAASKNIKLTHDWAFDGSQSLIGLESPKE